MSKSIYKKLCPVLLLLCAALPVEAQNDTISKAPRLTIGGYGEAVYNYNFYSDNVFRYSHASRYTYSKGYGRVDLPHAVFMLGYDFGHGWTLGTEVEFEHGGTEVAVEKETEETGEFEQEVERGGEVALEQFWVQKSWSRRLNLRMGHIVVPVGRTNQAHTPDQFFSVYRPEGENTLLLCTWHETGISLWGRDGHWRYEIQLLPALNSNLFTEAGWIHNGSASPYEFRPANSLAAVGRIDWRGPFGLRLGISGYVGNSFSNDIVTETYSETSKYYGAKGTVLVGAFDFSYKNQWLLLRGNVDYGHLGDAGLISTRNKSQNNQTGSPYPHTAVGEQAWDAAIEAGVDLLSLLKQSKQSKLYLFGRYDHYDSFVPSSGWADIPWCERRVVSAGVNYYPLPQIAVKAEAGVRLLAQQYNNEPFVAMGITWSGFFER